MRSPSLPLTAVLAALIACSTRGDDGSVVTPASQAPTASPATTDLEELHAFARLYGYVRFFHPSDEGAAVDWNAFAVHGVQQVTAATTRAELAATLETIFGPVAPTLDVHAHGQTPPDPSRSFPAETEGLDVVAWQHRGFGFGDMTSVYASKRTHRRRQVPVGHQRSATVTQEVPAESLRGKQVRLRAWSHIDPDASQASVRLQLRVDSETAPVLASANGAPSVQWSEQVVEARVAADASVLSVGGMITGQGAAWLDDFALEVRDEGKWAPVPLTNAGFDQGGAAEGWTIEPSNFKHQVREAAHQGSGALWVARRMSSLVDDLFEQRPQGGELLHESLGAGLSCQLPLALYARGDVIVGRDGAITAEPLPDLLAVPRSADDPAVRVAAVIVAWNVFQHFYPYFGDVEVDWMAQLDASLVDVLDDESAADTRETLQRLVAALVDGHGSVRPPYERETMGVPARFQLVEGKVVVMVTAPDSPLRRGDVLLTVDGEDVQDRLEAKMALASGSPQWRAHRVLAWSSISEGPKDSAAHLGIDRDGVAMDVTVPRADARLPAPFEREPIVERKDGIWILDLATAEWPDIAEKIDAIAAAPGVVLDLRGYPNGTHPIIGHLLTEAEHDKWMFVPQFIAPDHQVSHWDGMGWDFEPMQPPITGKVAFITGGGAISYAESVMGYAEALPSVEIVGGPTAGANGNINPFTTPGGYMVVSTGMRVTKHDGRKHHGVGVLPTIAVEPTVAGVRAGRDELLERAIASVTSDR